MRYPRLLLVLLLLSGLLLACGEEDDGGDSWPAPTAGVQTTAIATEVPTEIATEAATEAATEVVTTADIEASAGINVNQVFVYETADVAYNIGYPEGWTATIAPDETTVIVAETESAATALAETGDALVAYLAANAVEGTGVAVLPIAPADGAALPTAADVTAQYTANSAFGFGETTPYTNVELYPDATATPFTIGANSGVLYVLVNDEISVVVWSIGPRRDAVEALLLQAVAFPLGGFE